MAMPSSQQRPDADQAPDPAPDFVVDLTKEQVFDKPILPKTFGCLRVCAFTHIGTRQNQEDRFVCAPNLLDEYSFFGVFDGTVKEHASEWVHKHILPTLVQCPSFLAFHKLPLEEKVNDRKLLPEALRECYLRTDEQLLKWCAQKGYDYTACTSVTVLIHLASAVMYVAHIGDSHAVIGSERPSTVSSRLDKPQPIFSLDSALRLTMEHKPNQAGERARIERCGGRLIYLKNNRPFIRGGDFGQRDHAMQLNYSRAFGGKDLKMYGLSAEPDLAVVPLKLSDVVIQKAKSMILERDAAGQQDQGKDDKDNKDVQSASDEQRPEADQKEEVELQSRDDALNQQADALFTRCVVVGSDGLWDVMSPNSAVNTAAAFHEYYDKMMQDADPDLGPYDKVNRPLCSAERLVQCALSNDHQKGSTDNVTAICVFIEPSGAELVARALAQEQQDSDPAASSNSD